ncbi:MAG: hypothetical protein KVP17_002541 [Porospora cf. gigantea B]|uniref:uncharacterized protein n=1 Tax=Porospora cf. gigantea B TaxID=2853592 RepID=UPI0035719286|nr:MAG: hypothetical protein KVP17_002541 [Porospora cf. gigantea B]
MRLFRKTPNGLAPVRFPVSPQPLTTDAVTHILNAKDTVQRLEKYKVSRRHRYKQAVNRKRRLSATRESSAKSSFSHLSHDVLGCSDNLGRLMWDHLDTPMEQDALRVLPQLVSLVDYKETHLRLSDFFVSALERYEERSRRAEGAVHSIWKDSVFAPWDSPHLKEFTFEEGSEICRVSDSSDYGRWDTLPDSPEGGAEADGLCAFIQDAWHSRPPEFESDARVVPRLPVPLDSISDEVSDPELTPELPTKKKRRANPVRRFSRLHARPGLTEIVPASSTAPFVSRARNTKINLEAPKPQPLKFVYPGLNHVTGPPLPSLFPPDVAVGTPVGSLPQTNSDPPFGATAQPLTVSSWSSNSDWSSISSQNPASQLIQLIRGPPPIHVVRDGHPVPLERCCGVDHELWYRAQHVLRDAGLRRQSDAFSDSASLSDLEVDSADEPARWIQIARRDAEAVRISRLDKVLHGLNKDEKRLQELQARLQSALRESFLCGALPMPECSQYVDEGLEIRSERFDSLLEHLRGAVHREARIASKIVVLNEEIVSLEQAGLKTSVVLKDQEEWAGRMELASEHVGVAELLCHEVTSALKSIDVDDLVCATRESKKALTYLHAILDPVHDTVEAFRKRYRSLLSLRTDIQTTARGVVALYLRILAHQPLLNEHRRLYGEVPATLGALEGCIVESMLVQDVSP